VSDNGVGMDSTVMDQGKEGHFGLRGMGERVSRMLMAAVLTAVAAVPWLLQALRLTRYTYERAEIPGTLVTLALAFLVVVAFLRTRA
jgi:hypothetical protein